MQTYNPEEWSQDYYDAKVKEINAIQLEQLAGWKLILKPKIYDDLEEWVDRKNAEWQRSGDRPNPFDITRGTDLDRFIGNLRLHLYGKWLQHPKKWM